MNNQKDTQKTDTNSLGQKNVLDIKTFKNKRLYEFANKKTEKIVIALYMVTDCMENDDALKTKSRYLGIELLSDMYKLSSVASIDIHNQIPLSIDRINEIISLVEIAYSIGFISDMNKAILKKEFIILVEELQSYLEKDKHFAFKLEEEMFMISENEQYNNTKITKNLDNGQLDKRTAYNIMSLSNSNKKTTQKYIKKSNGHSFSLSERKARIEKILKIIKTKELPIKDISSSFTNCSEKTIQRELNRLVLKGQVKKIGSKRWSRYISIK